MQKFFRKYPKLISTILFIFAASFVLTITPVFSRNPAVTLRSLGELHGIDMGAAVAFPPLKNDPLYQQLLPREFNLASIENSMKFEFIHPQPQVYAFDEADYITNFAKNHQMKVFAHVLVWHIQLPKWLTEGKFTREQLITILRDHIHKVVGRYQGKVKAWDVVNEAFNDDGTLRNTFWLQGIGPDYIEMAFRWAREADPNVGLYYNDYGAETVNPKSNAIYNLVNNLKAKGVPITGVGFQAHLGLGWTPSKVAIQENLNRFSQSGFKIHISEMDVQIQGGKGTVQQNLEEQAKIYADLMEVCLSNKSCKGFTVWGLTDKFSWIPGWTKKDDAPLLFDVNYRPKPAYYALIKVLQNALQPVTR